MVIKRSAAEQADLNAALHVQGKKDRVSLADVTARMKQRNLQMAAHLKACGVELPAYYADVLPAKKRGVR
jgi:hypothetical protein